MKRYLLILIGALALVGATAQTSPAAELAISVHGGNDYYADRPYHRHHSVWIRGHYVRRHHHRYWVPGHYLRRG